jgi:BirA family biotin operon repressor/biotin-[acetyl-CoA-carboxylase] ligase
MCPGDGSDGLPDGWRRLALESVGSTNAEAMRLALEGEAGPLWITASEQTAGRGRSGRLWLSAEGALAATLLMQPGCEPAELAQLSFVAGVAAHEAAAGVLPTDALSMLRLKWPNDVLLDGAKLVGILVESTFVDGVPVAAIGIGMNVAGVPSLDGRAVTALGAHGASTTAEAMGAGLARALARWLAVWERGRGFDVIREAWLARAGAIGEAMSVHAGGARVSGRFAGLGPDGSLLLEDDTGGKRAFAFGDVALGAGDV